MKNAINFINAASCGANDVTIIRGDWTSMVIGLDVENNVIATTEQAIKTIEKKVVVKKATVKKIVKKAMCALETNVNLDSVHWVDNRVCPVCGLKAEISTDTVEIDELMVIGKTETSLWHCPMCGWTGADVKLPSYGYWRMTKSDFAGLGLSKDEIIDEVENQQTYAEWLTIGKDDPAEDIYVSNSLKARFDRWADGKSEDQATGRRFIKDLQDQADKWLESQGLGIIQDSEIIGDFSVTDEMGETDDTVSEYAGMSIIECTTPDEAKVRAIESLVDHNPRFVSKDKLAKLMAEVTDSDLIRRLEIVDEIRRYYWYLNLEVLGRKIEDFRVEGTVRTKVLHPVYASMVHENHRKWDINAVCKMYPNLKAAYKSARKERINEAYDHRHWVMWNGGLEGDFFVPVNDRKPKNTNTGWFLCHIPGKKSQVLWLGDTTSKLPGNDTYTFEKFNQLSFYDVVGSQFKGRSWWHQDWHLLGVKTTEEDCMVLGYSGSTKAVFRGSAKECKEFVAELKSVASVIETKTASIEDVTTFFSKPKTLKPKATRAARKPVVDATIKYVTPKWSRTVKVSTMKAWLSA